jgi:pyrroline-5-carboxylate reductase
LIGLGVNWSASKGLEPGSARLLVAATFVAAGRMIAERPEPMDALIRSLATPGGITERGLHVLADHGMAEGWTEACEAVLEKLTKGSSRSMG